MPMPSQSKDERRSKEDANEAPPHLLERVTAFLDSHIRLIQYSVYALGLVGLVQTLRSVKTFSKFTKVGQIPGEFVAKNVGLRGRVRRVESDGTLMLDHEPIVNVFTKAGSARARQTASSASSASAAAAAASTDGLVPVQLAGISATSDGREWLKSTLLDRNVCVTMLVVNEREHLECVVVTTHVAWTWRRFLWTTTDSVNLRVVQSGLATVRPDPGFVQRSVKYRILMQELTKAERRARRKRVGIWMKTDYDDDDGKETFSVFDGLRRIYKWFNYDKKKDG